ncbi:MAG: hypothetical protein GX575_06130 [Candidatus Anammoximicrobium sp.]|nr:hypothetical protein [Candidatus Anammoximicrobium sp.]
MKMRIAAVTTFFLLVACPSASAEITRIWLTHRAPDPSRIVVNWQTAQPGNSVVRFGLSRDCPETVAVEESVTLHHVEIPLAKRDATYHYRVSTGDPTSGDAAFKSYPTDVLRVAVAADWQGQPKLDAILRDSVHLLLAAGDHIDCLHRLCGVGVKDRTRPYGESLRRPKANLPEEGRPSKTEPDAV